MNYNLQISEWLCIILGIGYLIISFLILRAEYLRTNFKFADSMSGLSWAFLLTVSLPTTALYVCLPHMDLGAVGQLSLLGIAATKATPFVHMLLLALTAVSWASICLGYKIGGCTTRFWSPRLICNCPHVNRRAWIVTVATGIIACTSAVILMKTFQLASFGELVTFITFDYRVNWTSSTKGFLDSLAFSFINSLLPLSLLCLSIQSHWRVSKVLFSLPLALILVLLSGSRRAALVLLLVMCMSQLSRSRRLAISIAFPLLIITIAVVLFGRSIIQTIGDGNLSRTEILSDQPWDHAGYISSELAISQIESLSTLTWFDGWPRMGVDHLLSMLRLLPEKSILGVEFAERFTRHATSQHIQDPSANDIPVGFIGAAWVDGYLLGIFFLPMTLGLITARFDIWIHSRDGISGPGWYAIAYLNFIIYFQTLNTGSLDFTMSPTNVFVGLMCVYILTAHTSKQRRTPKLS